MHRPVAKVVALTTALLGAGTAHAREVIVGPFAATDDTPQEPTSMVLADLGLHVIGIGYQHSTRRDVALQIDADFYSPWTKLLADDHGAQDTVGAVVRTRLFYYFGSAPVGPWISPFVQAGFARGDSDTGLAIAGGASVGWTWSLPHSLDLAVGVGVQLHYVGATPGFDGVWPHADLNVGYAF